MGTEKRAPPDDRLRPPSLLGSRRIHDTSVTRDHIDGPSALSGTTLPPWRAILSPTQAATGRPPPLRPDRAAISRADRRRCQGKREENRLRPPPPAHLVHRDTFRIHDICVSCGLILDSPTPHERAFPLRRQVPGPLDPTTTQTSPSPTGLDGDLKAEFGRRWRPVVVSRRRTRKRCHRSDAGAGIGPSAQPPRQRLNILC